MRVSERSSVQNPMLKYAAEIGWQRIGRDKALALRCGDKGLVFASVLRERLLALNPGIVDEERADDILRRLGLLNPTMEGNREALTWLRGGGSVYVPEEKRERN